MLKVTKHFLVSGHVQGVAYRAFVLRSAGRQQLLGWVRNLSDGRVEILARGDANAFKDFEKDLLIGPKLARVAGIEERKIDKGPEFKYFDIIQDGVSPWRNESLS